MTASTQTLLPAAVDRKEKFAMELPLQLASSSKTSILPFVDTLHYPGCGCPASWSPGGRVCDRVDALVSRSHQLFLAKRISANRPLRICYMLPHHNITGGMKCLVEHVRLLRQRGHYTIAVHRSDSAKRAMPPWTTVEADADVVCNLHQRLSDVYPVQDIDVVVVGIFHQVAELLAGVAAPVLYWEQGHEWVFGDPIRLQSAQNYQKQDQLFHMVMHLPVVLAGVSSAVLDILQQEFGRSALLIPNGIDCDRFTPGSWQTAAAALAAVNSSSAAQDQEQQHGREVTAAAANELEAAVEQNGQKQVQQQQQQQSDDALQEVAEGLAGELDSAVAAAAAGDDRHTDDNGGIGFAATQSYLSAPTAAAATDGEAAGSSQQQDDTKPQQQQRKKRILIVGNPALPLKGFPTAIAALAAVAATLPIQVRWVCQVAPTAAHVPNLPLVDFDLDLVISPDQSALPALYRGHDVFLFTSRYEAWGMPVLEAMACGVPVVTTDCLGVRTFCHHGTNCLIAAPDDPQGVAQHLLSVLTDPDLSKRLSDAGRATAVMFSPDKVMDHLEAVLYCLTACGQDLLQLRHSCIMEIQQACTHASQACSRSAQQQQQQLQALQQQLKQHLQQHQQQLMLLQQQQRRQQQQASLQSVQLQSLRVIHQLDLAGPSWQQQQQQQQQIELPLQASLLMPFLQAQQQQQQQQQQPGLLQLQLQRSSAAGPVHQAAAVAAVAEDLLSSLAVSQQHQPQQQQQQVLLPTSVYQQRALGQQLVQQAQVSRQLQQQQQQQISLLSDQQQQQQQLLLPNHRALQVLQQLQSSQQQQQQQLAGSLAGLPGSSIGQQQQHQQLLLPASSWQQQQQILQQQPHASLYQQSSQHLLSQQLQQPGIPLIMSQQQQQQQQHSAQLMSQHMQMSLSLSPQQQQQQQLFSSQQLLLSGLPALQQQQQHYHHHHQQHQLLLPTPVDSLGTLQQQLVVLQQQQ